MRSSRPTRSSRASPSPWHSSGSCGHNRQFIVQQDGRIRASQERHCRPPTIWISAIGRAQFRRAGVAGAGVRRTTQRAAGFRELHQSGRKYRGRQVHAIAADPLRADPASRFDFLAGRPAIHRAAIYKPQGREPRVSVPTVSTSAWATAATAMIRCISRRIQARCSARCCEWTVGARQRSEGYNIPASNPFVGQAVVLPEIWVSACGIRGAGASTIPRAAAPAHVIGDVGQNSSEEIDYEPAGAADGTMAGAIARAPHDNVTALPPFSLPLTDPIFGYGRSFGGSITGGSCIAGLPFPQRIGTLLLRRLRQQPHLVNSADRQQCDRSGHRQRFCATTRRSLARRRRSPASFGVDALGELYVETYGGSVHRIVARHLRRYRRDQDSAARRAGDGYVPCHERRTDPRRGHRGVYCRISGVPRVRPSSSRRTARPSNALRQNVERVDWRRVGR